jgi:hypothetical protein
MSLIAKLRTSKRLDEVSPAAQEWDQGGRCWNEMPSRHCANALAQVEAPSGYLKRFLIVRLHLFELILLLAEDALFHRVFRRVGFGSQHFRPTM